MRRIVILIAAVAAFVATAAQAAQTVNRCTSPQQICAAQNGGRCNPKNGAWAIGTYNGRFIGGSVDGWQDCIDKLARNNGKR
jgi:hypothetical protein